MAFPYRIHTSVAYAVCLCSSETMGRNCEILGSLTTTPHFMTFAVELRNTFPLLAADLTSVRVAIFFTILLLYNVGYVFLLIMIFI